MANNFTKISLVTPMYNEEDRIAQSIDCLKSQMDKLGFPYEIILVNDGSTDNSLKIAQELEKQYKQLKLIGYSTNGGRGKAIRLGFSAAKGDIIVTTESDSSWGDDIILRLVDEITSNPEIDFVIASPHLKGGGYKNVPKYRVWISELGNTILRWTFPRKITMATGMTRCYKREVIDSLVLESDRKEIHLEILSKALILGYKVSEIPAVLTWKKDIKGQKRKSKFKIFELIWSHLLFSINEKPTNFIGTFGLLSLILGFIALFINIYGHIVYAFSDKMEPFKAFPSAVLVTLLILLGIILLVFAFISIQNRRLYSELIRLQAMLLKKEKKSEE